LAKNAIPAIVLHEPANSNIFNQNVASFLNEATETLKQMISEIEDCKTKNPHEDYTSAAV
jgi:hypothetical protein